MNCWSIVCHGCGVPIASTDEYNVYQEKEYCIGCWIDFRDEIGWYVEQDVSIYFDRENYLDE
jgi:hypothetical protein